MHSKHFNRLFLLLLWATVACSPMTLVSAQVATQNASVQSEKPKVELIGVGTIDGTAIDLTGLQDALSDQTPHNQFGGISGIDWIQGTNRYRVVSDRGPQDGAVNYHCRFHDVEINIDRKPPNPVTVSIARSAILRDLNGLPFVGSIKALQPSSKHSFRLDPEAIRVDAAGETWVSDEYGPHLIRFNSSGQYLQGIDVPSNLRAPNSSASPSEEDQNLSGRRANRGMEGLAITPSGRYLFGLMQSALLQDGYDDSKSGKKVGPYARIVRFDLQSGESKQFIYRQESDHHKLHEILAIDENRFLVIEQDGKAGPESRCKKIFEIDLTTATEIAPEATLAGGDLPSSVVPVAKREYLDLLDQRFSLTDTMPEKIEGITWGQSLPDGRRTLVVASDNDFRADQASYFYVFAIPSESKERFSQR